MIGVIAMRELRSLFLSPLAWSILAVVHFIVAFLFLSQLELFINVQERLATMPGAPGITELVATPMLQTTAFMQLLIVPLVTMRLFSEEQRARSLPLLLSAPVSMTSIVLGKYFGVLSFLLIQVLLILSMPLSLLLGSDLDFGLLASATLGLVLMLAAFATAGMFMSSLTDQPTVAAVSSFGLLLLLWIIDWAGQAGGEQVAGVFSYVSLLTHFDALLKGEFNSRDVIYFLLFSLTFALLTIRRIDNLRLQH